MPKNKQISPEKRESLKEEYFRLKEQGIRNESFVWLKKNKWEFLLPAEQEQKILAGKFKQLLLSNTFNLYFDNPVLHEGSYVYVTQFIGERVNVYVTTKDLLSELRSEIRETNPDVAISFLVLRGRYQHKGRTYDVRVGAYGVLCSKLTRVFLEVNR